MGNNGYLFKFSFKQIPGESSIFLDKTYLGPLLYLRYISIVS